MEIVKEITVKLSAKDVKEIIIKHLKTTQNLDVTSVYFDVNGHEQDGDWRAEYPLSYQLDYAICKTTTNEPSEEISTVQR